MTPKSRLTLEELKAQAEPESPAAEATPKADSSSKSSAKGSGEKAEKSTPRPKPDANGEADLEARQEIAEKLFQEMFGQGIEWQDSAKGICPCPNRDNHSGHSKTECVIWVNGDFKENGWPTLKCAHSGCQDNSVIKTFNHELRSRIGKAEHGGGDRTPSAYLRSLYPQLTEKHGDPIECTWSKKGDAPAICVPVQLNEAFFAALLVREGNDKDPAVFDLEENKWLRYCSKGSYQQVKAEMLHDPLDKLLLDVARKCTAPNVDTKPLQFYLRSTKILTPIITKASGMACVDSDIWQWPPRIIPVANGVVDIGQNKLLPHSPDYYFRGVVAVDYVTGATCPRWTEMLGKQLEPDDVDLIQRLAGLTLIGRNVAQVMTLLYGAAGSSKGTVVRVIIGLIGQGNTGTLRTSKLDGRFEMGRHCHKLLLYGADVDEDFLSNQGAALLKSITGEDPLSVEFKNSNVTPPAKPIKASVLLTTNSRLRIRFQGDKEAWRRRLIIVPFDQEVPEDERLPSFSEKLLESEGPGILNWGLEGARRLLVDGGRIILSDRQRRIRDALLDESESSVAFAKEGVVKDGRGRLLASKAYEGYVGFCTARKWAPETPQRFWTEFKRAVVDSYGITQSTDLVTASGNVRGWRGIRLKNDRNDIEDEDLPPP